MEPNVAKKKVPPKQVSTEGGNTSIPKLVLHHLLYSRLEANIFSKKQLGG